MGAVARIEDGLSATVTRSMDAARLNAIANDPAVRPHIGRADAGPLDYSHALQNPHLFCLEVPHGVFLFDPIDGPNEGRFELHTFLLPEGRGAAVLPAARAAFRFMFTETDCREIVTKVPAWNRPADLMARRAGFQPIFSREAAWEDGSAVTYFALTLDAWRAHDDAVADEGHAFHKALEAAKRAAGSELPTHPDDDAHDRAVGAAMLMAKAGKVAKAVWSYNRWARLADYQPLELLKLAPPVIDVRDALITFRNSEMEILQCRVQP